MPTTQLSFSWEITLLTKPISLHVSHVLNLPLKQIKCSTRRLLLAFLGGESQRKRLMIPSPGTIDYRPSSAVDMIASLVDLAGAGDEVSYAMGRSLLTLII
ncbi:hypothetical protein GEMRC1_003359 [Eukaryota sp. GEM-RC1]